MNIEKNNMLKRISPILYLVVSEKYLTRLFLLSLKGALSYLKIKAS